MSEASYDVQHLALHAAGSINAAGATVTVFGCQLTRISTGTYGVILDADAGVTSDECFTMVTPKGNTFVTSVVDTSDFLKTITNRRFDPTIPRVGSLSDANIEVVLWKSVTR
jgi:hypothetical protein